MIKHENAHEVENRYQHGTATDGPYLDEIRAAEEKQRRKVKEEKYKVAAALAEGKEKLGRGKSALDLTSAQALQDKNDLIEREAAEAVDKVILKNKDQVKVSDAHNAKIVGRVPKGSVDLPTNPKPKKKPEPAPENPKEKAQLPVERASVPPVTKEELNKTELKVVKSAQAKADKRAAKVPPTDESNPQAPVARKVTEAQKKVTKKATAKKASGKKK